MDERFQGVVVIRAILVQIGNGRGIRLAKPQLEIAGLADDVEIVAAPADMTITPLANPRAGCEVGSFIGQFQPLTSLTPGGRDGLRSQYRPHGEFFFPGIYEVYYGNTTTAVHRGCCRNSASFLTS
jgi:hypothetical protein